MPRNKIFSSYFLRDRIGNKITKTQSNFGLVSDAFTVTCDEFYNVILGVSRHRSVVERVGLTLFKKRHINSTRNLGDIH